MNIHTEPADEISRLRNQNKALVKALEECPLPSTLGSVGTHYQRFYDWYTRHVDFALALAKEQP